MHTRERMQYQRNELRPISSHSKKWETAQYKPIHVSEGSSPQPSASALFKIHQRKRPA